MLRWHSGTQKRGGRTTQRDQIDNEARLFWKSIVKTKHQSLTSLAFIRLVPGADRAVRHICIRCMSSTILYPIFTLLLNDGTLAVPKIYEKLRKTYAFFLWNMRSMPPKLLLIKWKTFKAFEITNNYILKCHYDETHIFSIKAILKHKQVACMSLRRKMLFTIFNY